MATKQKGSQKNQSILRDKIGVERLCEEIAAGREPMTKIAKRMNFSMGAYYDLCREDAEFEAKIQDAYIRRRFNIAEHAEAEGFRRVNGYTVEEVQTEEGRTSKGTISLVRKTQRHIAATDGFLQFLMKNGLNDRYTEKVQTEDVTTIKSKADYDAVMAEIAEFQKKLGLDGNPNPKKSA